jgi:hypothetical protein
MRMKEFSSSEELQAFVESMRLHSTLTPLRDVEPFDGSGAAPRPSGGAGEMDLRGEQEDQAFHAIR